MLHSFITIKYKIKSIGWHETGLMFFLRNLRLNPQEPTGCRRRRSARPIPIYFCRLSNKNKTRKYSCICKYNFAHCLQSNHA